MTELQRALVLFSGGQDSATCLAWALEKFDEVETLGFDYGQNHRVELDVRLKFLQSYRDGQLYNSARLGKDHVLDLGVLGQISDTSLTKEKELEFNESGIPNTFVPARNLLFSTFAAAIAYRRGIKHIVLGVCETDYSGYPDCRDDTIKALQVALNLGMDTRLVLHTPLMWLDKSATWQLAQDLGQARLVDLIKQQTHTCYEGDRSVFNEWGYGCGSCPACELRMDGWNKFRKEKTTSTEGS
jgi:7-cyano-7-deazaguanine synthase